MEMSKIALVQISVLPYILTFLPNGFLFKALGNHIFCFGDCTFWATFQTAIKMNPIQRLVDGGSLLAEAEQTIAARKAAFNKALRKFKKEQTPKNHNNAKKCNLHFGE